MQPCSTKFMIRVKGKVREVTSSTALGPQDRIEEPSDIGGPNIPSDSDSKGTDDNVSGYTLDADLDNTSQTVVSVSSSEYSTEDEAIPAYEDLNRQMIPFGSYDNDPRPIAAVPLSSCPLEHNSRRESVDVDTFTVQCANCLKWRLIPEVKKYEEIREHITVRPFVCETASEWRAGASCDDPPDIEQDGSRLWAIDKPNIIQPPSGWKRILKIRRKGGTKFADVYYTDPLGISKLRSIPEVERFLKKHTEYEAQGVTIAQFSFQSPKPLEEDYVRKRPRTQPPESLFRQPPPEVLPLAWAPPEVGMPGFSAPFESIIARGGPEKDAILQPSTPEFDQANRVSKKPKKAARGPIPTL